MAAVAASQPELRLRSVSADELEAQWAALGPMWEAAAATTLGRWSPPVLRAMLREGLVVAYALVDWAGPEILTLIVVHRLCSPDMAVGEVLCLAPPPVPPAPGAWAEGWQHLALALGRSGCEQVQFSGPAAIGAAFGLSPTGGWFVAALRRQ